MFVYPGRCIALVRVCELRVPACSDSVALARWGRNLARNPVHQPAQTKEGRKAKFDPCDIPIMLGGVQPARSKEDEVATVAACSSRKQ